MKFSFVEAGKINEILESMGIYRNVRIFDPEYCIFSSDLLEKIEEFVIVGFNDISFLRYFPNLKRVVIKSHDYNQWMTEGNIQDTRYFNQIKDFSILKELTNLEEIHIENDLGIQELDVRGLTKLKNVYLMNNPRLRSVIGLDEQHHLENVIMYGNNIEYFSNPIDYLYNTLDAKQNILDVGIFFIMIDSVESAKKLNDIDLRGLIRVLFSEKAGLVGYTTLSIPQITDLYIKFRRLFEQKELMNKSDYDKIEYVFRYVTKYIQFATTELQERERLYSDLLTKYQEIPEFYKKNLGMVHNSYRTYHFRKGNCEGTVNLMRFMLFILGIPSENVHCHDRRFKQALQSNHALLRAKCDGKWLYYDATYDRKNVNHYFGKTFDEISEFVDLSIYENVTSMKGDYYLEQSNGANIKS